jgi:chloride channel protein, CIC family
MTVAEPTAPPSDPSAMLRSRGFVVLLVFAAAIGIVVSFVSWGFLELVHQSQIGVFDDLPGRLGFDTTPTWWPLPILAVAGVIVAFAIARLPGNGGHIPAKGLQVGGNEPADVPGVALAAFGTLALGLVLGPEAPLIAIGAGLAAYAVKLAKRDAPPQLVLVVAAAGSFAAVSVVFGSPIVAAVVVIEASGLGGATLPLILIPGLIASGMGALVFTGMADWTGLSTSAYSLVPLHLTHFSTPTWAEIGWTVVLGIAAALVTFPIRNLGLRTAALVPKRPFVVIPIAGLAVAGLAICFGQATTHAANEVLFSGQDALPGLVANEAAWSLGALGLLVLLKGVAWGLSLGSFRGGPTFPALFIGAAGGIAASHLPGLPMTPAVAVGMAAMVVAVLRLPLSAAIIATALTVDGGADLIPLIIVGVVVSYLATLALEGRLGPRAPGDAETEAAEPAVSG